MFDVGRAGMIMKVAGGEDRALLRSNPSADPGAKTEGRVADGVSAAVRSVLRTEVLQNAF
jgi:hypothetical protein